MSVAVTHLAVVTHPLGALRQELLSAFSEPIHTPKGKAGRWRQTPLFDSLCALYFRRNRGFHLDCAFD